MKQASVRDLRYNFREVERALQRGEIIDITKRNKVIGELRPKTVTAKPELPDFAARLREIWGGRKLKLSNAELIARDRDRY